MVNAIEFENGVKCGREFGVSEGSRPKSEDRNPKESRFCPRRGSNASAAAKIMAGQEDASRDRILTNWINARLTPFPIGTIR